MPYNRLCCTVVWKLSGHIPRPSSPRCIVLGRCCTRHFLSPLSSSAPRKRCLGVVNDLNVFRTTRGIHGTLPGPVFGVETLRPCHGPLQKKNIASRTGGSSQQPNGSWSGGTRRRRRRAGSPTHPSWVVFKGNYGARARGGGGRWKRNHGRRKREEDGRQRSKAPGQLLLIQIRGNSR